VARSFSSLSIRWRLTATYVALVVAIALVLGFALYRGLEAFLLDDAAARATADVQRVVARELGKKPGKDPGATPAARPTKKPAPGATGATGTTGPAGAPVASGGASGSAAAPPAHGTIDKLGRTLVTEIGGRDTSVVVLWPDRSLIAASAPIPDVAPWPVPSAGELDAAMTGGATVRRVDGGREPRAMLLVDTIRADDGTVLAITVVATSLEGGDSTLAQLRLALILALVAAVVLGVALGLPITRISLRPLDRVVAAAQRITAGDRGVRVGAADVPSEIGRLGVAFDTMVERLEASAEAQRRFVADASHELRTPLAALGGMTEVLLLGIDQGDEAAVERVLTAMNREIARLGRLAGELLALSRLEDPGGRLPLLISSVPIAEVATEVVAELGGVLDGRRTLVDVPPDLVVGADRDRLKQVLVNLLENAARHTERGGSVVITAAREATDGDGAAGAVRMSVTDDGTGLTEADADRIFDRFFRADQARGSGGGAGLGLSIVRAIAEAHGGRAEASSPGLGLGATVSVVIPDAAAAPAAAASTAAAGGSPSQDASAAPP
jgi:two-component system OmpR family sensor kinase